MTASKPGTPAFTFGYRREPADQAVSDAPGPGDYAAEERQAWLDGPAYTISQAGREADACKAADTPGRLYGCHASWRNAISMQGCGGCCTVRQGLA